METVAYMEADLQKAAAKGIIDCFKDYTDLRCLLTPNENTILHIYLTSPSERSTDFIGQVLGICPSLLVQINVDGDTPLHIAARYGHSDAAKALIEQAKAALYDPTDVESGEDATTRQMAAARQMVRITNKKKETALHEAARNNNGLDVVKAILSIEDPEFTYSANDYWEPPLYIAADNECTDIVIELLSNPNSQSLDYGGPNGKTALNAAIIRWDVAAVSKLLERMSSLARERDENGWTPLHYAAYKVISKRDGVLKEVLQYSSLIYLLNGKDGKGNTPLHLLLASRPYLPSFIRDGDTDVFKFLKQKIYYGNYDVSSRQEEIVEWMQDLGSGPFGKMVVGKNWDEERKEKEEKVIPELEKAQDSHLVAAALVATVTFAAAFTLPGGYVSDENESKRGTPILSRNSAFKSFVITDAIAMVLSTSSVFIHFIMVMLGYKQRYYWLIRSALWFIVFAMGAMVVAFVTGTYAVLAPSMGLAIATCVIGLSFFLYVFYASARRNEDEREWTARGKSRTALAELTLPESELRRLRNLTYQIKSKVRVKGAGVTQEVVDTIHERWKDSEIVRVKVEGAPALNMRRMHEILERKTGGLVIWRSGTSVSLYRGVSYEVPLVQLNQRIFKRNEISTNSLPTPTGKLIMSPSRFASSSKLDMPRSNSDAAVEGEEKKETGMLEEVKYEDEVNNLLEGLGPRYTDWPGLDPLPVDADLLPGIVPGYQPPFRILPYGVRSTLGQKDNILTKACQGSSSSLCIRSRQLQGLAVAMIKLWEKSSIAKIALKRGVQLTTSERMAEDIKKLTGGMLLSRNKDFLVFYRGKDFLSPDVSETLLERERLAKSLQDKEEQARLRASALVIQSSGTMEQSGTAGTLKETLDADARWGKSLDDNHREKFMREVEIARHANLVRKLESKLVFAEKKLTKAERALSKVEEFLKPAERQADPDSITDEERYMFRKLGLRMKAFLLLGRRGVFDGTVENMHLHWKYLDRVSKGYAIIVFRGKNYQRPSTLRPRNLLTKRKALARSVEMQRREALVNHVSALQMKVDEIRCEIGRMESVKDEGDEELYDRLDASYPTDAGDNEEEGDEACLGAYNSEYDAKYDDDDETGNIVQSIHLETNFPCDVQSHESETETEGERYPETFDGENDDDDGFESDDLAQNHHTSFPYNDRYEAYQEALEGESDNDVESDNSVPSPLTNFFCECSKTTWGLLKTCLSSGQYGAHRSRITARRMMPEGNEDL
ncbi:hypothetical protein GH714_004057 [Hevea brasiliensis]|uniref:CRM domain-containing protein n=1 Tax=Hevea brasiliensis TaxID=3981 RepID=A0A6A6KMM3_HEVBR|nr:hypothetical protein GH714_004057 [Hevea brasiliensis]